MERRRHIAKELSQIMPRIARALTSHLALYGELSPTQIFALLALQDRKTSHFSDLCDDLYVSAPTATGIVDRLERAGYVKREPDKKDRRAIHLVLTPSGSRMAQKVRQGVVGRWEFVLNKLPLSDCEHYFRIVKKLQQQMDKNKELRGKHGLRPKKP